MFSLSLSLKGRRKYLTETFYLIDHCFNCPSTWYYYLATTPSITFMNESDSFTLQTILARKETCVLERQAFM